MNKKADIAVIGLAVMGENLALNLLMSRGLGMSAAEMQPIFRGWNASVLDSYLIEITAEILSREDP